MQEWPLEMFVERAGATGGATAAVLVLVAALVLVGTLGWRGRPPAGDFRGLGRLGIAARPRPARGPIARRWAIAIAAGAGLILGGAIGAQLGWLGALDGGAIGVIIGALCGAGNPALSQIDGDRENGRGPA